MSELTERSKCVFQAKLAEQAERYDGTTTITFRFMCAYALFTRARVYIFVLNWNHQIGSFCSIIFSFKMLCLYICKETNTIAFSILTILLTQCRDDRGFEETVRDSGYWVDGTLKIAKIADTFEGLTTLLKLRFFFALGHFSLFFQSLSLSLRERLFVAHTCAYTHALLFSFFTWF